jgi:hypothetical protein
VRVVRSLIAIGVVVAAGAGVQLLKNASAEEPAPSRFNPAAFNWLAPAPAPVSWSSLHLPESPASLLVPPGWHAAHGDPGTKTAETKSADGDIDGYLNVTPQQGKETLANWSEFRLDHNEEEGNREDTLEAAVTGVPFPQGKGSCVLDSYRTSTDRHYREIACIVAGRATSVIVGAAPPSLWAGESSEIEHAIASFET